MDIEHPKSFNALTTKYAENCPEFVGETSELRVAFLNEYLFFDKSSDVHKDQAIQLTLENVDTIRTDPFRCYQNVLSNNPQELEHEYTRLSIALAGLSLLSPKPTSSVSQVPTPAPQVSTPTTGTISTITPDEPPQMLLLDSTRESDRKDPSSLSALSALTKGRVVVGRSYLPCRDASHVRGVATPAEKNTYTPEFVCQKTANECFLDKNPPAIIGPFIWSAVSAADGEQSVEALCVSGVSAFGGKYNAPAIVQFGGFGGANTASGLSAINSEEAKHVIKILKKKFADMSNDWSKLVVSGLYPKVTTETSITQTQVVQTRKVDLEGIELVISEGLHYQINLFAWIRAGLTIPELVHTLKHFLNKKPDLKNISLGLGLVFKTDHSRFGGSGATIFIQFLELLKQSGVEIYQIDNLIRRNALNLLCWWRPLVLKKVEVLLWKCDECEKEFEESVPKITKLDFQFCSPKCFKSGLKKIPK